MFRATCKSQIFDGDYSVAVHKNGAVRRKECGTGLPSVGETRHLLLEHISRGIRSWWTGDSEIFVRYDSVLNNDNSDFFHIISLHEAYKKYFV